MLRRCWAFAILGVLSISFVPVWGQTSSYNKDAVQALSKRIDQHLAKTWKEAKVSPAPKADDYVFFRRLNLDLNGRIPDLSDIGDFIDNDAPDKRWEWVDRYLAGADHGKHFGNVWRNIIIGSQTNVQLQFLTPQFEAYLRDKVEKNVALDKMVLQLLTSQQDGNTTQLGFGGRMTNAGPQLFFQANENKAENLASATSRVFLGVKLECAQCHAHPFAKWKQDQFWEFAAFYSVTPQVIRRPNQPVQQPMPGFTAGREILIPGTEKVVKAKFLNGKAPNWDTASGGSRKILADWVTASDNPFFAKAMADHIWSYLMGVSILEPIMEPSDDIPMTHPDLLDDMAKALVDNGFDAKFLIRAIVHSEAYQRSSGGKKLADKEDYHLFTRMPMRALTPEQIYDSLVFATTNPTSEARKLLLQPTNPQQFFNGMQANNFRQQFLLKFTTQDRRYEPQTSILQALFLMNGKFMAERTKVANNEDLQTLAQPDIVNGHDGRLKSMFRLVLSRPPQPAELDRLIPYLERGGATGRLGDAVSDIYWALLNSSEFLHNH